MSENDNYRPDERGPSITSTNNERIRYVRSLYRTTIRKKEGLFIVEGIRLLEEALDAGASPELVLVDEDQLKRTPRGEELLNRLRAFDLWTVNAEVMDALSDTVSPQGVIALFRIPTPPENLELGPVGLILDGVRDPGNAGTLLRSADASGVVRTVAFVDSVDAYAPKVVRSAMGAHFRLTILEDVRLADLRPRLGERPVYLATVGGSTPYTQVDWKNDCALMIGGEAEGAGAAASEAATTTIRVPMAGLAESLNAAMAGTVILFDAARVRREAGELPEATGARRPAFEPPPPRRPRWEGSREGPRRFEEEERRGPSERGEFASGSRSRESYRSEEEGFPRREGRPWERREDGGFREPRGEGRPPGSRGEGRPWESRGERAPFGRRDEGRPDQPRGEGRPYQPRGEREPFRGNEGRRGDWGEGRPGERRENRYEEPRGEGRPFTPRGGAPREPRNEDRPYRPPREGRPWERRDEGGPFGREGGQRPFRPREGNPYPPRGEGRPYPPRGEGRPYGPGGEGRPFGGGGFRGKPRGGGNDQGGPHRPRDESPHRPGGYRPNPPRDRDDDRRGPRR